MFGVCAYKFEKIIITDLKKNRFIESEREKIF